MKSFKSDPIIRFIILIILITPSYLYLLVAGVLSIFRIYIWSWKYWLLAHGGLYIFLILFVAYIFLKRPGSKRKYI